MENLTKIKVGAVSYLNTLPMISAIQKGALSDQMELQLDYPSRLAELLRTGQLDAGLIPVAMIPSIPGSAIVSDYCIATEGEVASVCIFSRVPLEQAKRLLLDYQSRTSVALAKILLKHHWKLSPELVPAEPGYETSIPAGDAALIIGDRALECRHQFSFVYDLGLAWKEFTGLPFVFAAWVSGKQLPDSFLQSFNRVIGDSLDKVSEIAEQQQFGSYDLYTYYTKNIHYVMDENKKKALALFLEFLGQGS